jgi:hypothetical protein
VHSVFGSGPLVAAGGVQGGLEVQSAEDAGSQGLGRRLVFQVGGCHLRRTPFKGLAPEEERHTGLRGRAAGLEPGSFGMKMIIIGAPGAGRGP